MKYQFIEITFTSINQHITRSVVCFLRPNRLRSLILGILLLFFFNPPIFSAGFGNNKMLQPYANYTVTADDNILRNRDNIDPVARFGTKHLSDISQRMTGGIIFEKEISRQRLSADFYFTHTRFERFNDFNNNLKNLNGNWNWFLGNRLEGNIGATYVQSLMPFTFLQQNSPAIRTEKTQFINAAWRFHPSWSLNGEYTRYDLNLDTTSDRFLNLARTEDRFEGGLDYVTSAKNTLGVLFRNINGDFNKLVPLNDGSGTLLDNGFDQKEVMAKVNWAVSKKSRLLGTLGWVERKNASLPQRDFSGFNARMNYHWQPTDRLGLMISGWRTTGTMQNLTASYSLNTGVSVVPSWDITEKVRLEGDLSYETRNFSLLAALTDSSLLLGQHNTLRNAAIKLIYSPYPGLQLNTSVYHSDLKTDSPLGGFNANGANVNLQYIYGKR